MVRSAPFVLAVLCALALPAATRAQDQPRIGAAPAGDPARIALRTIHENFSPSVCPRITEARRQANGSIHAVCEGGETFRVFAIGGQTVAMRCAAAARHGIEGC